MDSLISRSDSLLRELRESRSSSSGSARGVTPYAAEGITVARAAGLGALAAGTLGSVAERKFMLGAATPPSLLAPPFTPSLVASAQEAPAESTERASLYSLAGLYSDDKLMGLNSEAPGNGDEVLLERLRAAYAAAARMPTASGSRARRGWDSEAPDGSARGAALAVSSGDAIDTCIPIEDLCSVIKSAARVRGSEANALAERVRAWIAKRDANFAKRHETLRLTPGGAPRRASTILRWGDVVDAYLSCALTIKSEREVPSLLERSTPVMPPHVDNSPESSVSSIISEDEENEDALDNVPEPLANVNPDGSGVGGKRPHLSKLLGGPLVAGRSVVVVSGGRVFRKGTLTGDDIAALSAATATLNAAGAKVGAAATSKAGRSVEGTGKHGVSRPPLPPKVGDAPAEQQENTVKLAAAATCNSSTVQNESVITDFVAPTTLLNSLPNSGSVTPSRVIVSSLPTPSREYLASTAATPAANLQPAVAPMPLSSTHEQPLFKVSADPAFAQFQRREDPRATSAVVSLPSPPPLALIDCVPFLESAANLHPDTRAVLHPAQTLRLWHCFVDAVGGMEAPLKGLSSGIPRQHPVLVGGPARSAHLTGKNLEKALTARAMLPQLSAICARLGYDASLIPCVRADAAACISQRDSVRGLLFSDFCDFVAGVLVRGSDAHAGASSLSQRAEAVARAQSALALKSAEAAAAADALRASVGLAPRRHSASSGADALAAGAEVARSSGVFSDSLRLNAADSLYSTIPLVSAEGDVIVAAPFASPGDAAASATRDGRLCSVLINMVDGWVGSPGTDPWYGAGRMDYDSYATTVLRAASSVEAISRPEPTEPTSGTADGVSHAGEASAREHAIEIPAVSAAAAAATPSSEKGTRTVEQVIAPAPTQTAISTEVNVVPSHPFALNTLVFARFKGGNTAYRGAVAGVRLVKAKGRAKTEAAAVFYSIAYDDGDEEDDVPARFVRFRGSSNEVVPEKPKAAAVSEPVHPAAAADTASVAPASADVSSAPAEVIALVSDAGLSLASPAPAAVSIAAAIAPSTRLPIDSEGPLSATPPTGAAVSVVVSKVVEAHVTTAAVAASSTETEPCRDVLIPTLSKAESKDDDDSPGLVIIAKPTALTDDVAAADSVAAMPTTTFSSVSVSASLALLTSEAVSSSESSSLSQLSSGATVAVDPSATPAPPASSVSGEMKVSATAFDLGDGESKTSSRPTTPTRSTATAVKFSKTLVSPGGGAQPSHRSNSPRSTSLKK